MIDLESIYWYYSLFLRVNFDSTINTCYINKICLFDRFGIYSWVLFMGSYVLFGIIHESHCTISTNFYLYLPYIQQKNFNFSKISGSQIDLNNIITNTYVYHTFIYSKEKVWPFVWIILGSTYLKLEERRYDSMFTQGRDFSWPKQWVEQNEIQQTSRKRTCPSLKIWLSSRKLLC